MEKIVFSSFASERDPGFRICTQITEREGKKTVRKTALNEAGKPHVRKLKKNEEGLIRTYKDVPFFRVCPVTDQGDDWVEFAYQEGQTLEQWFEKQRREGKTEQIREMLQVFWQNLLKMSGGEFVPGREYTDRFGSALPDKTPLHGASNQDIDLIFSNLFLSGTEEEELADADSIPHCCIVTDYEWVFPFDVPLEYIYYRSVFCSIALSRFPDEEKNGFYSIAGIRAEELDRFLETEICFQHYISGNTKTMAEHYQQLGQTAYPLPSVRQIIGYTERIGELETQVRAQGDQIQGYVDQIGELETQVRAQGDQIQGYVDQIGELETQVRAQGDQIQEAAYQIGAYETEWNQLAEAGLVHHSKPAALIRREQEQRKESQQAAGSGPDATIVIPTKNGGDLFRQVLDHVFGQVTQYTYEVICVDSGSSDNTIQIIQDSPARLIQIKPEEFGHGKTRNFGASHGTGEFICFLTQDALPVHESWLENMLNAMKSDPQIAGGFGRHLPYSQCNFIDERDINGLFAGFGQSDTIYWNEDPERYEKDPGYRSVLAFFSDNNSCIRRSVWEQYPYPEVEFAEDQIWMRQMIEKGYKKVYCPEATVYHSHNYDPSTYFMRYYDEHKGLYEIHGYTNLKHWWYIPAATCKHVLSDIKYIRTTPNPKKKKLGMIRYSIRRNYARYAGGYIGGHYHEKSPEKQEKLDRKYSQQYRQRRGING